MQKFWERSGVKKHLSLPLFLSVAVGFVFLLYWAVDCLPLSIAGKLVVAGVVSLLFLFSGIFLLIKDWRRKVIEEYVVSKKSNKKGMVLS
jgi:membrane protein YdbS with pleckstrin-like domain